MLFAHIDKVGKEHYKLNKDSPKPKEETHKPSFTMREGDCRVTESHFTTYYFSTSPRIDWKCRCEERATFPAETRFAHDIANGIFLKREAN